MNQADPAAAADRPTPSTPPRPAAGASAPEPVRLPDPTHGRIELIEDRCTSCMICVRECPTWCISLESHSEVVSDAPGHHPGRSRKRTHNVLDSFDIDWSLCMYCGICIEECPFDALQWAGAHLPGAGTRAELVLGRDELAPPAGDAPGVRSAGQATGEQGSTAR